MENIRVVIVGLPRMASEMLRRAVSCQSNMEVVAERPTYADLPLLLRRIQPDALVLGLRDVELPAECEDVIRAHPEVKVLGLSRDTQWAVRYELRPEPVRLDTTSLGDLLEELKAIAPPGSSA